MAQVITLTGERLFALKAQNNQQLDIDTFIFAYVPGQDSTVDIDRNEGLPPVNQRVHQQIVQQYGMLNDNAVVYSSVLDSLTGPFQFNWVGLYSAVNQTLVAIQHIPTVVKTVTEPGASGNILNRNFVIEYSGIAELTGITVDPATWQYDFNARLNGMDELTRQLAADMNGKDWFIGDGFKVVPRSTLNTFKVTAGAGYVSGLRVELAADHILTLSSYPQFVYVDAWFDGTSESIWKGHVAFTVTNTEMDDYIDVNGRNHYVFKLARITAADVVEDLRNVDGLAQKIQKFEDLELYKDNLLKVTRSRKTITVGDDDLPFVASERDAFQVARTLTSETDCHGFSDKTTITDFKDVGTYGAFDSTVKVCAPEGKTINHVHSFQDRITHSGGATLEQMAGLWSFPTLSGDGDLNVRYGALIGPVNKTGTGVFGEQIGISIYDLGSAISNYAVVALQSTGKTIYAPNAGEFHLGGNAGVGGIAPTNVPLVLSNRAYVGGKGVFFDATTNGFQFGVLGGDPSSIEFVSSGGIRLQVKPATSAVTAGQNNVQSLGDPSTLWTQLFAASNTINQSDKRVKTDISDVPIEVLRAWSRVKTKRFKYIKSVEDKGESARWHVGKVAQDIEAEFKKEGLNAFEYAVLCFDKWPEQIIRHTAINDTREVEKVIDMPAVLDADGNVVTEAVSTVVKELEVYEIKPAWDEVIPAGERFGVRYEQAALLDIEAMKARMNGLI